MSKYILSQYSSISLCHYTVNIVPQKHKKPKQKNPEITVSIHVVIRRKKMVHKRY